ncbi:MAG: gamma-glutamylcyclotransferase family protein, partial [Paracoccaceae bacterium]
MTPIFLYGTLRHPPLLGAMAEAAGAVAADIAAIPAQLPDHVVRHAGQEVYPQIFAEPGAQAQGILVQADADLCAVLDFYEGAYGYALRPVTVVTADGARSAQVYWPPETIAPGPIWDLAAWVHEWGALTVSSAPDILRLRRAWAATDTRAIRPFAQARGWARQLAQTGAPATVRHSPAPGDVQA